MQLHFYHDVRNNISRKVTLKLCLLKTICRANFWPFSIDCNLCSVFGEITASKKECRYCESVKQLHCRRPGVFIVDSKHIPHLFLVFFV